MSTGVIDTSYGFRLYKAKDEETGEWVKGYLWRGSSRVGFMHPYNLGYSFDTEPVEGQEHGRIRSKNYVKSIYVTTLCEEVKDIDLSRDNLWTNDIVDGIFYSCQPIHGVVGFKNGSYGIFWVRGNVLEFTPFSNMCNVSINRVGNIFDNPELVPVELIYAFGLQELHYDYIKSLGVDNVNNVSKE